MLYGWGFYWESVNGSAIPLWGGFANAQVIPDNTLSSIVSSLDGWNFMIDGGARSGPNLFHSFQEFSVPTGGSVIFQPVADVQTIFSRITGNRISNIDGLLQVNGNANLFLLNPNGLLFGPNARFNVPGSLIGTTADRIQFADGVEFPATDGTSRPVLTVSAPIGLQMTPRSGPIRVQGNGNDGVFPTANLGLVSSPGQSLIVLGNGVNVSRGVVTALSGRLEVGSVASGIVRLKGTFPHCRPPAVGL